MIRGQFSFSYNVDIIMCIDATASMGPILDEVKRTALTLPRMFLEAMDRENKHSDSVRFKVIAFRDFGVDSEALIESDFFSQHEGDKFERFVKSIEPSGGGDIPENALEALAYAIKSDWQREGTKKRHVVLLFTDAPALDLSARRACKHYPKDPLPSSLPDFIDWWDGRTQDVPLKLDRTGKRLVMFAPLEAEPWASLKTQSCIFGQNIEFASGGRELDMPAIISLLVHSI